MRRATASPVTRRRGVELEEAILAATLDQLATVGLVGLTMEGVAAAAQTGKASVYRRWASKEDLVVDALHHAFPPVDAPLDTGNVRSDLLQVLREMLVIVNGPAGRAMQTLMGEVDRDQEFVRTVHERVIDPRKRRLLAALRRGAERGQVRPEAVTSLVADVGPALVVHRFHTTGPPVSDHFLRRVVDEVLMPVLRP